MLGVKGNVGSDIALVANFSVWKTSGIWVMYAGVRLREPTVRPEICLLCLSQLGDI